MPYILQKDRFEIDERPYAALRHPGELNYLITLICLGYLGDRGTNYQTINDIVGVLECAKQEFYRRLAAPYEDTKIEENGDVYPGVIDGVATTKA